MSRKDRTTVQGITAEKLRPQASPAGTVLTERTNRLDTFVTPADTRRHNAGSGLADLARGLMQFNPSLQRFVTAEVEQHNEGQYQEGREKALEIQRTAKTYKDAVDRGLINRKDNPFFVAGVQEQYGAAMAGKFDDDMREYLQHQGDLDDATDPKILDKHVAEFRERWESENLPADAKDKHFQGAYAFTAQKHVDDVRSAFVNGIGQKIQTRSITAHFSRLVKTIKTDLGKVPVEDIAAGINGLNADLVNLGFDREQVLKTTLRAIGETAEQLTSKEAAHLFDLVTGKDGAPLADASPEYSKYARETLSNIVNRRADDMRRERDEKKLEDEATLDIVAADATNFILGSPNGDLKPFVDRVKHIRGAADEILKLRATAQETVGFDDQNVIDRAYTDIWINGASERDILKRFKPNGGISLKSLAWLHSQVRARDGEQRAEARASAADARDAARLKMDARREYHDLVNDPLFRQYLGNVAGVFVNPNSGILSAEGRDAANKAEADLIRSWITWRRSQPVNADPGVVNDWLSKNAPAIVNANRANLFIYGPDGTPKFKSSPPKESTGSKPTAAAPLIDLNDLNAVKGGKITPRLDSLFKARQLLTKQQKIDFLKEQAVLLASPNP